MGKVLLHLDLINKKLMNKKDRFDFNQMPLVQWASGAVGFHGEGYWYHSILKLIPGFTKNNITPVFKTVTQNERKGKTPLNRKTFQPKEWFPNSIWVRWFQGSPVNAVGLSNFGIKVHTLEGQWHQQKHPFYISIMAVGEEGKPAPTVEEKVGQIKFMVDHILTYLQTMPMLAGVQINLSCGNTGHDQKLDMTEAGQSLDACVPLREAGLQVIPKITADTQIQGFFDIAKHPAVTAIAFSNAIQYEKFSDDEKLENMFFARFGSRLLVQASKLVKRVGLAGSVSGLMLFPRVLEKLKELEPYREHLKPFVIGGGIISPHHLRKLVKHMGPYDKIALGSVIFLRPWRIKEIRNTMQMFVD
jgi:dihydroorotate dehydrogenase